MSDRNERSPGFAEAVERELSAIRTFDELVHAVRDRMQATGTRQKDLAERSGILAPNLSRLLNSDDGNPELDTLTRLADALGCDLVLRPRRAGVA